MGVRWSAGRGEAVMREEASKGAKGVRRDAGWCGWVGRFTGGAGRPAEGGWAVATAVVGAGPEG